MRIEVKDLYFDYLKKEKEHLLAGIDLCIPSGSFLGVVGINGAGKSTLAQLLAGILKPSSGEIFFERGPQKAGLVFQFPEEQFFEGSLFEDCAYPLRIQGLHEREIKNQVEKSFSLVGLDKDIYKTSPFELSGGEARLAAIAAVLAAGPEVLILDEPTAGLDPEHGQLIIDLLKRLHKDRKLTVIVISHHLENILSITEQTVLLHQGRVGWQGRTDRLLDQHELFTKAGLRLPPVAQVSVDMKSLGWKIESHSHQAERAFEIIEKAWKEDNEQNQNK